VLIRRGRVYVEGTAEGFKRMREQGVPAPSFRLEDQIASSIRVGYEEMFDGLIEAFREAGEAAGYSLERSSGGVELVEDADPGEIVRRIADLMGKKGARVEKLRERLRRQLADAEEEFFEKFLADADPRTVRILVQMELPKADVFRERLGRLRELYVDQAVQRIKGEEDDLKKAFLQRLVSWSAGRAQSMNVTKILERMRQSSDRRSRYFARDQMQLFNKSLTMASFEAAEAPYVEPITVGDMRVRPEPGTVLPPEASHRAWNHKIFTREALLRDPRYIGKYSHNCRCGFVPHYELTAYQRARLIT
jgi:hypothetical protein